MYFVIVLMLQLVDLWIWIFIQMYEEDHNSTFAVDYFTFLFPGSLSLACLPSAALIWWVWFRMLLPVTIYMLQLWYVTIPSTMILFIWSWHHNSMVKVTLWAQVWTLASQRFLLHRFQILFMVWSFSWTLEAQILHLLKYFFNFEILFIGRSISLTLKYFIGWSISLT